MTPVLETSPAGQLDEPTRMVSTDDQNETYRYLVERHVTAYTVKVRVPVPPHSRVTLELGTEAGAYWARIPELDVTAEGASVEEALNNVISASRSWLEYLRHESPQLGGNLEGQDRYIVLLDAFPGLWFKSTKVL